MEKLPEVAALALMMLLVPVMAASTWSCVDVWTSINVIVPSDATAIVATNCTYNSLSITTALPNVTIALVDSTITSSLAITFAAGSASSGGYVNLTRVTASTVSITFSTSTDAFRNMTVGMFNSTVLGPLTISGSSSTTSVVSSSSVLIVNCVVAVNYKTTIFTVRSLTLAQTDMSVRGTSVTTGVDIGLSAILWQSMGLYNSSTVTMDTNTITAIPQGRFLGPAVTLDSVVIDSSSTFLFARNAVQCPQRGLDITATCQLTPSPLWAGGRSGGVVVQNNTITSQGFNADGYVIYAESAVVVFMDACSASSTGSYHLTLAATDHFALPSPVLHLGDMEVVFVVSSFGNLVVSRNVSMLQLNQGSLLLDVTSASVAVAWAINVSACSLSGAINLLTPLASGCTITVTGNTSAPGGFVAVAAPNANSTVVNLTAAQLGSVSVKLQGGANHTVTVTHCSLQSLALDGAYSDVTRLTMDVQFNTFISSQKVPAVAWRRGQVWESTVIVSRNTMRVLVDSGSGALLISQWMFANHSVLSLWNNTINAVPSGRFLGAAMPISSVAFVNCSMLSIHQNTLQCPENGIEIGADVTADATSGVVFIDNTMTTLGINSLDSLLVVTSDVLRVFSPCTPASSGSYSFGLPSPVVWLPPRLPHVGQRVTLAPYLPVGMRNLSVALRNISYDSHALVIALPTAPSTRVALANCTIPQGVSWPNAVQNSTSMVLSNVTASAGDISLVLASMTRDITLRFDAYVNAGGAVNLYVTDMADNVTLVVNRSVLSRLGFQQYGSSTAVSASRWTVYVTQSTLNTRSPATPLGFANMDLLHCTIIMDRVLLASLLDVYSATVLWSNVVLDWGTSILLQNSTVISTPFSGNPPASIQGRQLTLWNTSVICVFTTTLNASRGAFDFDAVSSCDSTSTVVIGPGNVYRQLNPTAGVNFVSSSTGFTTVLSGNDLVDAAGAQTTPFAASHPTPSCRDKSAIADREEFTVDVASFGTGKLLFDDHRCALRQVSPTPSPSRSLSNSPASSTLTVKRHPRRTVTLRFNETATPTPPPPASSVAPSSKLTTLVPPARLKSATRVPPRKQRRSETLTRRMVNSTPTGSTQPSPPTQRPQTGAERALPNGAVVAVALGYFDSAIAAALSPSLSNKPTSVSRVVETSSCTTANQNTYSAPAFYQLLPGPSLDSSASGEAAGMLLTTSILILAVDVVYLGAAARRNALNPDGTLNSVLQGAHAIAVAFFGPNTVSTGVQVMQLATSPSLVTVAVASIVVSVGSFGLVCWACANPAASVSPNRVKRHLATLLSRLYDNARDVDVWYVRVYLLEDMGVAFVIAALSAVYPPSTVACLALLITITGISLAHVVYLALVHPYNARSEQWLAMANAILVCGVSLLADLVAANPSWDAFATTLGVAMLCSDTFFFLQTLVLFIVAIVECLKDHKEADETLVTTPSITNTASHVVNHSADTATTLLLSVPMLNAPDRAAAMSNPLATAQSSTQV